MAKISISAQGRTIEVEDDKSHAKSLVKLAHKLWSDTHDVHTDRIRAAGYGQFERADTSFDESGRA